MSVNETSDSSRDRWLGGFDCVSIEGTIVLLLMKKEIRLDNFSEMGWSRMDCS